MIAMRQLNELFHFPTNTFTSFSLPPAQSHTYIQDSGVIRRQLKLIPAGHGGMARRIGHLQY